MISTEYECQDDEDIETADTAQKAGAEQSEQHGYQWNMEWVRGDVRRFVRVYPEIPSIRLLESGDVRRFFR